MRENGHIPVALLGVKRSMASAGPRWLLQYEDGSLVSPRLMHSFMVRIVLSTCPLALLLPGVMRL